MLKNVDVLIGLQWGDEGKGKIVDRLSGKYDIVARFQGGPNAGHTIYRNNNPVVLHQVPSSIFTPGVISVIGDGVVLNLRTLAEEFAVVIANGGSLENLKIGQGVNLILPSHCKLDELFESKLGEKKFGTTKKGIGPVHEDRAARRGVRINDLRSLDRFDTQIHTLSERHIKLLQTLDSDFSQSNVEDMRLRTQEYIADAFQMRNEILPMLINCSKFFFENRYKEILAEGAQGALLDVMHGEVPNVTSSHISPASACVGLGIPTSRIRNVIGLCKAYVTKVGSGVLPTKQNGNVGATLQERGHEYGATTGRKRDCGYLDLPALAYACRIVGPTELVMTKADVLFGSEIEAKVATAYIFKDGTRSTVYDPDQVHEIDTIEYHSFGKLPKLGDLNEFNKPKELEEYCQFISQQLSDYGVSVNMISFGPEKDQVIEI